MTYHVSAPGKDGQDFKDALKAATAFHLAPADTRPYVLFSGIGVGGNQYCRMVADTSLDWKPNEGKRYGKWVSDTDTALAEAYKQLRS